MPYYYLYAKFTMLSICLYVLISSYLRSRESLDT
jgi:hypothetical protein